MENLKTDLHKTNIHSKQIKKKCNYLSTYAWDKQIKTQTEIKWNINFQADI